MAEETEDCMYGDKIRVEGHMKFRPGGRGFIDMKQEMLWIEWQTLARHYTDDALIVGEWYTDIVNRYTEKGRVYHTLEHVYQMVLNYRQYYDKMTYPRNVMFAIFFHDIIYDPQAKDNEALSVEEFRSCAEDLELDEWQIGEVAKMIERTVGHKTEEHDSDSPGRLDLHYFLDIDLSILGANSVEYTLYAKKIRQEYIHVTEDDYCTRRAAILEKFLERKFIFATPEFRQFAEENARKNVTAEVKMLKERHVKRTVHTCKEFSCKTDHSEEGSGHLEISKEKSIVSEQVVEDQGGSTGNEDGLRKRTKEKEDETGIVHKFLDMLD